MDRLARRLMKIAEDICRSRNVITSSTNLWAVEAANGMIDIYAGVDGLTVDDFQKAFDEMYGFNRPESSNYRHTGGTLYVDCWKTDIDEIYDLFKEEGQDWVDDMIDGQIRRFGTIRKQSSSGEAVSTSSKKTITQTYDVVTPESAENGDFAENGFTGKKWNVDYAEEAYGILSDEGPVEWVGSWWYSMDPERDWSDGSETYYGFHPEGFSDEEIDYINRRLKGGKKEKEFCDPDDWDED